MGALGPMLAAALALWPGAAGAQSGASFPALFGTREIRSTNLTPFTKWTSLLERQLAERRLYDTPCGARIFQGAALGDLPIETPTHI